MPNYLVNRPAPHTIGSAGCIDFGSMLPTIKECTGAYNSRRAPSAPLPTSYRPGQEFWAAIEHDSADRKLVREFETFADALRYKQGRWFGAIEAPLFETDKNTAGELPEFARAKIALTGPAAAAFARQMVEWRDAHRQAPDGYDLGPTAADWQAKIGAVSGNNTNKIRQLLSLKLAMADDRSRLLAEVQKALLPLTGDALAGAMSSSAHVAAINDMDGERHLNNGLGYKVTELCRGLQPEQIPVTRSGQALIDALVNAQPKSLAATREALTGHLPLDLERRLALVRASIMTEPELARCRTWLRGLAVGEAHANFFDGHTPGPDRQVASVPGGSVHDVFTGGGEYKRLVFFRDGEEIKLNAIDRDAAGKPHARYSNWFDGFAGSTNGRWLVARTENRKGWETVVWDLEQRRFAKLPAAPTSVNPLEGGGYRFDWLGRVSFRDQNGAVQSFWPRALSFSPLPPT